MVLTNTKNNISYKSDTKIRIKGGEEMRINDTKFEIALARSGLTIGQAAERAGISRQRFAMILNQKNITPQAVGKVAKGVGVDVTEIIETEN